MSPPITVAASLVPSAEEVMNRQLREPAVVWSVQTKPEADAIENGRSETAIKRMRREAKRRERKSIGLYNYTTTLHEGTPLQ
jgi:hypothetical protein